MHVDPLSLLRDPARLRALADTELMDSPREARFDRYTQLAAKLLKAPIALISLVDDRRQFFKSAVGIGDATSAARETPLAVSFCKYAVAAGEPFVVESATEHPIVRDSSAVAELGIRAYAGMPLKSDGHTIGVLCVSDHKPRAWSDEQLETLRTLAAAVATEIELSSAQRELQERNSLLSAITESALDVILTVDSGGRIVFCNQAAEAVFLRPRDELYRCALTDLMPARYRTAHQSGFERVVAGGAARVIGRVVELQGLRANGEEFPLELSLSRWSGRAGDFYTAIIRDVTARSRTTRALREAEERLRLTVERAPIGMAIVAPDGRWLRVNDALCAMLGYSREEMLANDFQSITHAHDLELDLAQVSRLLAGESSSYQLEKRYIHHDGHTVWALLSVALVRAEDGQPSFFVAQILDLTARRHAEAEAATFFEHSVDMLAITGSSGKLERVNPAWERTLGWSPEELTTRPFLEFVHPDDRQRTNEEAGAVAQQGGGSRGFRNRYLAKDGNYRWLDWTSHRTEDGQLFCIARDVTVRMQLEEQIRHVSLLDELTSLQNRRGFMLLGEQQLAAAARYQRPLIVLFADVNGMKRINDELGHEEGDRLLVDIADVLRATFRRADLIARLGGDEFVVLAEGDASFARSVCERLDENVQLLNGGALRAYGISVSVGLALYQPERPQTLAQLLSAADKAMYEEKRRHHRVAG